MTTQIEETILGYAATCLDALTPPGTNGAAQFKECPEGTLDGAQDRQYGIYGRSAYEDGNRGLDGQPAGRDGFIRFDVVLRRVNEGMSARVFSASFLADMRGITDKVQRYVTEQGGVHGSGVGACVSESEAVAEEQQEPTIVHCVIPFKVEFNTTQVT